MITHALLINRRNNNHSYSENRQYVTEMVSEHAEFKIPRQEMRPCDQSTWLARTSEGNALTAGDSCYLRGRGIDDLPVFSGCKLNCESRAGGCPVRLIEKNIFNSMY